jgi:hypothetical protein
MYAALPIPLAAVEGAVKEKQRIWRKRVNERTNVTSGWEVELDCSERNGHTVLQNQSRS